MNIQGEARRVTVFMGEADRWHHKALHTAIVEMLRSEGCAGATVVKGIEGFGKNSRLHTAGILRLSEDLPVVLTFVDTRERVEAVLPRVNEMVGGGLVIVEDVCVSRYSSTTVD